MTSANPAVRHLKAHGRFPRFVYRAFTERSHAEDFVLRGRFRLGNLRVYATLENEERRDSSEGQGRFQRFGTVTSVDFVADSDDTFVSQAPGYVHVHTELLNPTFVLSCSLPGVNLDYLRSRFGPWVVRIDEPRRLAQELAKHLETLPDRFGGVEGCLVHYNKDGRVEEGLSNMASTRLSYSQKPLSFKPENEFRFVVVVMGTPGRRLNARYLPVDLGGAVKYATVI
jgi:hypothetical protein